MTALPLRCPLELQITPSTRTSNAKQGMPPFSYSIIIFSNPLSSCLTFIPLQCLGVAKKELLARVNASLCAHLPCYIPQKVNIERQNNKLKRMEFFTIAAGFFQSPHWHFCTLKLTSHSNNKEDKTRNKKKGPDSRCLCFICAFLSE